MTSVSDICGLETNRAAAASSLGKAAETLGQRYSRFRIATLRVFLAESTEQLQQYDNVTEAQLQLNLSGSDTFNRRAADLFTAIFHNLKLELRTQFPASNDEKYLYI